jgi:all-trans-retinol 13,14-reductase
LYDVIIIGSGPGGLTCGVNLTKHGLKVLILEQNFFYGGTSSIFKRHGYTFPMGPLSFSSPGEVRALFSKIGITDDLQFSRNQFQLITPYMDIIYSQEINKLRDRLIQIYPNEKQGIETVFSILRAIMNALENIIDWHPAYNPKKAQSKESKAALNSHKELYELLERYSHISAKEYLQKSITDKNLRCFLGTLGTGEPQMSMVLLAMMWYLMSEKGIWFPSSGIHGISDLLYKEFLNNGGNIKLDSTVDEILIKDRRCYGVRTRDKRVYEAKWIVSNADYKSTFLKLIAATNISSEFREMIDKIPYFGSEFAVYLGVEMSKIDTTRVRAEHLFYRKEIRADEQLNLEDFENREIEICFWSDKDTKFAPADKKALVLRVPFPYEHFAKWKIGERKRKEGYKEYKQLLANKLITTAENVLPGLKSSIEVIEIATPLTYEAFGQRFHGSIAGWSWAIDENLRLKSKFLIETPIPNLYMVGLYAAAELFLGGLPTAMYTGFWASELILGQVKT